MKTRFHICDLFGIPLYLDLSTIFIMLMFLQTGDFFLAVGLSLILAVSIVAHELGHSLVARCFGCRTTCITLTVIGGCASMERIPHKAWQEFLVAVAGPLVSFVLGVALLISALVIGGDNYLGITFMDGGIINITLGLFNLLPGFPMDGGRILRSVARIFASRAKATYVAMVVGRVAAVALVVLPFLGIDHIWIIPIGGNAILRILIAWMIWQDGYREYQLAKQEEDFRNWTQDDFDARVSPPPYDR